MYVCICNKLTEGCVRSAALEVTGSIETLYESLGAKPRCGRCLETAAELVRDITNPELSSAETGA